MNELMLYTLTYLLSQALGIYSIYKLVTAFFDDCRVNKYVETAAYVGYYILSASLYLIVNIPVVNLIINIVTVFLLTLFYPSSIKKKLLVDILTYIFMAGAEMIVVTLTGYINFPFAERNNFHSIFGIVVINILKYIVSMAMSGFKNIKNGNILPTTYWASLFIIPISSLSALTITFQAEGLAIFQVTISVFSTLIINFTVFFLFDRMARLYQEKQEKRIIEQQNKYYENQLQIISTTQKATNILRHDMKNHLCAIFSDMKKGNIDEAKKHISNIVDVYETEEEIIQTGYPAIDSMINFKLQTAKQNDVKINVNVSLPSNLKISSFDLTVILGNLVDNALQATMQVPENRFIDFAMNYSKGVLLIKISNPFRNTITKNNGNFITSKSDKKNHGFGLRSVNEAVENYNGAIEIEPKDNIFTVTAVLYV